MILKNKLCLNCLYYKTCSFKCVKDEYQHNIISICKGSYHSQNHTFNNSSIPGKKPKYMWESECESLGRRTASQNVAQLLLTVMNHTGLKWLPKCGTISADCEKLRRTHCPRKGQILLFHHTCAIPTFRHHATCNVTDIFQNFRQRQQALGRDQEAWLLYFSRAIAAEDSTRVVHTVNAKRNSSVALQQPRTPLVWVHTVNAKRAFQHSLF